MLDLFTTGYSLESIQKTLFGFAHKYGGILVAKQMKSGLNFATHSKQYVDNKKVK